MRVPSSQSTADKGSDCGTTVLPEIFVKDAAAAALSTSVFHSPHSGQRPSHLGSSCPQPEHRNTDAFCFFTTICIPNYMLNSNSHWTNCGAKLNLKNFNHETHGQER